MNEMIAIFLAYIPQVVGALAIVVAGVVLAGVARRGTTFVLRRLQFDVVCDRVGVTALLREGNIQQRPSHLVGMIIFYAVIVSAILAALGPLGLDFLAATLNQIILYAPRALTAVLLLILGTSAAGILAELTERTLVAGGVSRTGELKAMVRLGIMFIAVILASAVLGIDVTILIVITCIVLGGIALTAALAIGLGLRGLSQNIAASRYIAEGIAEGDRIRIDTITGQVERIGHAVTTVRDRDGRVYLIPNAYFLEHVVQKETEPLPQIPDR